MIRITSIEDLDRISEECQKSIQGKLSGADHKRHIVLCGGTGCLSSNSKEIAAKFVELLAKKGMNEKATVNLAGCFGFCSQGPFVKIYPEDTLYRMVTLDDVEEIVDSDIGRGEVVERLLYVDPVSGEKVSKQDDINFYKKQRRIALHGCGVINPEDLGEALGFGAFKGLKKALSMTQKEVADTVLLSGLRGRGGGGFPAGRKWMFALASENDEKYVVCNGDEGDPGAFMDRSILEGNPIAVIEGMMIAGYAIGAKEGYFYVRAEYPIAVARLKKAIQNAREAGMLGKNILGTGFDFDCHIRLGAGAFVCGEETALLTSIEGNRGEPRNKPPFPANKGLFQKPTIINNVETLANIPQIIMKGADWFASMGTEDSKGTKVFALGGAINNTGLVEIPLGTTLRHIIYDIGGGIPKGRKFKAVQTGGPSGGCIPAQFLDTPIDYANLTRIGAMMGSGGMIVTDDSTCMVDFARFFLDFTVDESCGKCTPCRIGTRRLLELLQKITDGRGEPEDLEKLEELCYYIKANALCALGQTAPNPVLSTLKYFRDEYEAHVYEKRCPAGVCKNLMHYEIQPDVCRGCTACARKCPVGAISGTVKQPHTIDVNKCIKCGACIETCRFGAIVKK